MLSKHVTKVAQKLEKKKYREKYNLFKVEGEKLVGELLRSSLTTHTLLALPEWIAGLRSTLPDCTIIETDLNGMKSVSNFQSPPSVIAFVEIPGYTCNMTEVASDLSLVLNGIQDPGNMGTILRLADWFGVRNIFCDEDCASVYNPKCVQASMGAIFRVRTFYTDLIPLLEKLKSLSLPIFGTFLDGENVYRSKLNRTGVIVMGNEGKGISPMVEQLVDSRLTIPCFATGGEATESLNVGVATGIILSEFRRRQQ